MSAVCVDVQAASVRCAETGDCSGVDAQRAAWCNGEASRAASCVGLGCYADERCLAPPCGDAASRTRAVAEFSRAVAASRLQAAGNPDDARLACIFYKAENDEAHLSARSYPSEEYGTCHEALLDDSQGSQAFFPSIGVWEDLGAVSSGDADALLEQYLHLAQ